MFLHMLYSLPPPKNGLTPFPPFTKFWHHARVLIVPHEHDIVQYTIPHNTINSHFHRHMSTMRIRPYLSIAAIHQSVSSTISLTPPPLQPLSTPSTARLERRRGCTRRRGTVRVVAAARDRTHSCVAFFSRVKLNAESTFPYHRLGAAAEAAPSGRDATRANEKNNNQPERRATMNDEE